MEQYSRQRYEAYNAFMRRHQKTVWRVCYDFARGDIQRCEDMVQEVWIMVWLKFDQLRDGTSEWRQRVWVRKVARSVLIDLYRKEMGNTDILVHLDDLDGDIADEDVRATNDIAERIDYLMASLNTEEQHLMRMRLEGYNAEEIATELNIVPNAVYQRINRIMKKLKRNGTGL